MRKFILIFLSLTIYISASVFSQNAVSINLPDINTCIGDTVTVPVSVSQLIDVGALGIKIQYDTNSLKFNTIKYFDPAFHGFVDNVDVNTFVFAWVTSYYPVNLNAGTIIELSFILKSGSSSMILLRQCEIVNAKTLKPYTLILNNGSVNGSKYRIEGLITYDNAISSPLNNVKVELLNANNEVVDTTLTDVNGRYAFSNLVCGKYSIKASYKYAAKGYTPTDALMIAKYFVKLYNFTDELKKLAADVNDDKLINPTDALLINRKFVLLSDRFAAGSWLFQSASVTIKGADNQCNIKGICVGDVNASYIP